jgi:hypothetical protein
VVEARQLRQVTQQYDIVALAADLENLVGDAELPPTHDPLERAVLLDWKNLPISALFSVKYFPARTNTI